MHATIIIGNMLTANEIPVEECIMSCFFIWISVSLQ